MCGPDSYLASGQADGHQVALGGLNLPLHEALFLVRHPASLLAIVGLALVDTFLLQRNEQVWGRIGVFALLYGGFRHFGGLLRLGASRDTRTQP